MQAAARRDPTKGLLKDAGSVSTPGSMGGRKRVADDDEGGRMAGTSFIMFASYSAHTDAETVLLSVTLTVTTSVFTADTSCRYSWRQRRPQYVVFIWKEKSWIRASVLNLKWFFLNPSRVLSISFLMRSYFQCETFLGVSEIIIGKNHHWLWTEMVQIKQQYCCEGNLSVLFLGLLDKTCTP